MCIPMRYTLAVVHNDIYALISDDNPIPPTKHAILHQHSFMILKLLASGVDSPLKATQNLSLFLFKLLPSAMARPQPLLSQTPRPISTISWYHISSLYMSN